MTLIQRKQGLALQGAILSMLGQREAVTYKVIRGELDVYVTSPDVIDDALEVLESTDRIERVILALDGNHTYALVKPAPQRTQWFGYRRIVPLFNGTPEWIVERLEDNKLYAWCPDEQVAARITEALNKP